MAPWPTARRHSVEGKHGTLRKLGEDDSTEGWGGSMRIEAVQPTGTLSDGHECGWRWPISVGAERGGPSGASGKIGSGEWDCSGPGARASGIGP